MVHALKEIWRVLAPGGILVDLRPLSKFWPVEVASAGPQPSVTAGRVDDSAGVPDDEVANEAMLQAGRAGLFAREQAGAFDFNYYWDTTGEMQAYVEERWSESAHLPPDVLARAGQLLAQAGAGSRVRIRVHMIISRWRKQGGQPPQ